MVREFFGNPLLKGRPRRGSKHTVKRHETGRRVSVKNPKGPTFIDCPHLAHLDEAEFDDLNAALDSQNGNRSMVWIHWPIDHLKRTRFPGQFGQLLVLWPHPRLGGQWHRRKSDVQCVEETAMQQCWNSISYDGQLAVERLSKFITSELYRLEGIDDNFRGIVGPHAWRIPASTRAAAEAGTRRTPAGTTAGERQRLDCEFAGQLFVEFDGFGSICRSGIRRARRLLLERRDLARVRPSKLDLPQSVDELRGRLETAFALTAPDSPEFGDLMRQLVPRFHVYLVRLCDGGHLLPRAKCTLALDGIITDARHVDGLGDLLIRDITIDLFDPPQRERIREKSVRLAAQGATARRRSHAGFQNDRLLLPSKTR